MSIRISWVGVRAIVASAGLALAALPCSAQITLRQTGAPFNNPIGVAYNPTNTSLIVSSNYPTGNPFTYSRIDEFGNTTQWSTASGQSDEVYLDIPRTAAGGFTVGEAFTGNGTPGQILKISADGSAVTNTWTTLPGESGLLRGQLKFDKTGIFGFNLLVTTTTGNVWSVASNGAATHLASLGAGDFEGITVVPNNPGRYGPMAGKIVVGDENSNNIWTIDTAGNVNVLQGISPTVEGLHIVPANERFVGVAYSDSRILYADSVDFLPYVGDLLVVSEQFGFGTSGLSRLLWNGSSFVSVPVPLHPGSFLPSQWEGSTFAPVAVPVPGAAAVFGLGLLIGARRRR
jgi:hypothetical protein